MALCVAIDENGFVRQTVDGIDNCTAMVLIDIQQYQLIAEPVLNAADIAYVFAWGFGAVVVTGYFGGYAIGIAKRLIGKT